MSTEVTAYIVYVLTALAAVVILLTRLRLGRGDSGRVTTSQRLLTVHTVVGVLALITWVVFLVADDDAMAGSEVVGIVALGFWWITVWAGLLILVRWLPSRGRHASDAQHDSWSKGPWLSLLAHLGLLVAVCFFTWAYLHADV